MAFLSPSLSPPSSVLLPKDRSDENKRTAQTRDIFFLSLERATFSSRCAPPAAQHTLCTNHSHFYLNHTQKLTNCAQLTHIFGNFLSKILRLNLIRVLKALHRPPTPLVMTSLHTPHIN